MSECCQICRSLGISTLIDAGRHPVSNRFLPTRESAEERFELVLGQCHRCGLVQLIRRMPPEALVPPYEWITYNEPEAHLDTLTNIILELPGIGQHPVIGSATYKDESTLKRLSDRGVEATWCLDIRELDPAPNAGAETLQARLTPEVARRFSGKYPPADALLVRHLLEHTYDTHRLVEALRTWVRPGGYLVIEVPDFAQALETFDYPRIWEEHILYFTPATFRGSLSNLGFDLTHYECYEYPAENSLVAIVRTREAAAAAPTENIDAERNRAGVFAAAFEGRRVGIRRFLQQHREKGGRIALFGAGHLAAMFVNLMDVADLISFVVDDHPQKQGMYMPGSRLPIKGSSQLLAENIDLCLSSLSPESEERVVARQEEFFRRCGTFVSIFPGSRRTVDAFAVAR